MKSLYAIIGGKVTGNIDEQICANAKVSMLPSAPAGIITLLANTRPLNELMLETFGCEFPEGHAVRYASGPDGTTVMVAEYAEIPDGREQ